MIHDSKYDHLRKSKGHTKFILIKIYDTAIKLIIHLVKINQHTSSLISSSLYMVLLLTAKYWTIYKKMNCRKDAEISKYTSLMRVKIYCIIVKPIPQTWACFS